MPTVQVQRPLGMEKDGEEKGKAEIEETEEQEIRGAGLWKAARW